MKKYIEAADAVNRKLPEGWRVGRGQSQGLGLGFRVQGSGFRQRAD
jgi:hypothetical protein